MRSRAAVALLIFALAACDKVVVPTKAGGGSAARKPPTATKSKAPDDATKATGPDVLRAPARDAVELTGTIALDARYAVGTGFISDQGGGFISDQGGGLISNNGGGVLAVKGAELLSNNAGNLVSRDPAGIISHHGAGLTAKVKLISDQGGGLISNNGGGLVSDQGGGLISDRGGGLISNNGGGLVAGGFLPGFGLLQAPTPRPPGALPHAAYPVAGMLVGVLSLADNAYLPLGVDREGKPIYAVYTDRAGAFKVHLPKALARNVLVVSSVAGTADPRLAVDLVAASADAQGLKIDDASTVLTGYLRRAIVTRFEEALDPDPCRPAPREASSASYGFAVAAVAYKDDFDAAYRALPRPARVRVLQRVTDAAIGEADLLAIDIEPTFAEGSTASGKAFPLLKAILAQVEAGAAKRLEASPTYFDDQPYVKIANRERGYGPPFVIRKPADFVEMITTAFLTTNDLEVMRRLDGVLVDIGLSPTLQEDMKAAGGSLFAGLGQVFAGEQTAPKLRAAIKRAIADEAGAPDPTPTCVPAAAAPGVAATTSAFAGTGEGGFLDGPAATARFDRPSRLAYDPRGYLLVSDAENHRIRRIDLDAEGHPVTTVAGSGEAGWADGPGASAKFSKPSGLALDGKGALYVAERGGNVIRKITGWEGAGAVVSTIAGGGLPAWADGQGTAARFSAPEDLAVGPDGALYVADTGNQRIRRVTIDGAVTTFAGSGESVSRNGIGLGAAFKDPRGVAFRPDGKLLVVDSNDGFLRVVGPDGGVGTFAGLANSTGFADGSYFTASFKSPYALAFLKTGEIVLADTRHHRIRLLDREGFVATLAGQGPGGAEGGGYAEGVGAAAAFNHPEGVAVAADGTIYVADARNHRIRKLALPAR